MIPHDLSYSHLVGTSAHSHSHSL